MKKLLPIGTRVQWRTYPYPFGVIVEYNEVPEAYKGLPYVVKWQDDDNVLGHHEIDNFFPVYDPNILLKQIL